MSAFQNNSLDETRFSMVAFELDHQAYALRIEPIVQVVEMVTILPLPQLEEHVDGVINVHGTLVPVLNLRRYFGLPLAPLHLHTPIILVRCQERTIGLIVDKVLDVLHMPGNQVFFSEQLLPPGSDAPLLQGLARLPNNQLLLLLNLTALFTTAPLCALLEQLPLLPGLENLIAPDTALPLTSQDHEAQKHESTMESPS